MKDVVVYLIEVAEQREESDSNEQIQLQRRETLYSCSQTRSIYWMIVVWMVGWLLHPALCEWTSIQSRKCEILQSCWSINLGGKL